MISILLSGGSSGNSTIFLPSSVRQPVLSSAPNTQSWYIEFRMLSCGGGSIKSNSSKFSRGSKGSDEKEVDVEDLEESQFDKILDRRSNSDNDSIL